jgi:hypothetical protein
MSGIVKPTMAVGDGLAPFPHYVFGEFAERYPCLAAYWVASAWPDGSAKKAGKPAIGVWGGKLQAQFHLIGTGLMVRSEIPDPILFWDALEALLSTVPVPWQIDQFHPVEAREGQKRKK